MNDKILSDIIELAKCNDDIEIVWLYGSQARGTEQANSDYDLAVAFKTFIDDPFDCRLRPELLAIDWQHKLAVPISVVDINKAPIPLAFTVIVDDTPLYVRGDGLRRVREENRIMSMWELDYEYSRKKYR